MSSEKPTKPSSEPAQPKRQWTDDLTEMLTPEEVEELRRESREAGAYIRKRIAEIYGDKK